MRERRFCELDLPHLYIGSTLGKAYFHDPLNFILKGFITIILTQKMSSKGKIRSFNCVITFPCIIQIAYILVKTFKKNSSSYRVGAINIINEHT